MRLGVITISNTKKSTQCIKAASKAMQILRLIKRIFKKLIEKALEFSIKASMDHIRSTVFRHGPHFW